MNDKLQQAINTVVFHLEDNKEFRESWLANLSMSFYDESLGSVDLRPISLGTLKFVSDKGAGRFLDLLINQRQMNKIKKEDEKCDDRSSDTDEERVETPNFHPAEFGPGDYVVLNFLDAGIVEFASIAALKYTDSGKVLYDVNIYHDNSKNFNSVGHGTTTICNVDSAFVEARKDISGSDVKPVAS